MRPYEAFAKHPTKRGDMVAEIFACFEENRKLDALRPDIESDTPRRWKALSAAYKILDSRIRAAWPYSTDPYGATDWSILTPIESNAWNAIRTLGLPFYPQYPVGRFFVDFADPVSQLAIECDGKAFHDAAKDALRDAELAALGWQVKRFTGRQCNLLEDHPESIDSWLLGLRPRYR